MTAIEGKTVLITGAAGGFGQQLIRQYLQADASLLLTDLDRDHLHNTAETIRQEVGGGRILQCIGANLASAAGCEALYRAVETTPDILINNAGIAMSGRFDKIPAERWELLMQVNLLAAMRITHHFVPDMIAQGHGHIVNISSIAGWVGSAGLAAYSASKYGLRGFGEALSEELAPYNINVTNVYPFYSRTPILDSPHYGSLTRPDLPDDITTDPADVIRDVLAGIRQDRLHVFPDQTAKRLHLLKRFVPGIIPKLFGQFQGE